MAEITTSTSGAVAIAISARGPQVRSGHSDFGRALSASLCASKFRPSSEGRATTRGRNSRICAATSSTLRPAASAYTWYRWLFCLTTSRVLLPIEPVEPRTVRWDMEKRGGLNDLNMPLSRNLEKLPNWLVNVDSTGTKIGLR